MACGHSEGGLSGHSAGRHDLGGVVRAVDLVGHDGVGDLVYIACDAAVERAAGDAAAIATKNKHSVRCSVSGAADDRHILADVERAAVRDAAAIRSVNVVVCTLRMAVPDLRRAGQGGVANITIVDIAMIADAAAKSIPIALSHRRAAGDAAAGHGEMAAFSDKHAAAISNIPLSLAADDAAAGHGELAAAIHVHTAAVGIPKATSWDFTARAAGDDAAGDGVGAGAVIRQQRPRVGGIIFAEILEGLCCRVVLQRQVAAVLDLKDAAAAGHLQDVAVQVHGGVTRNGQGGGDGHVSIQLIHAAAQVAGDSSQLCHVGVIRQRLGRQQRQRHDQRHQDRYELSFHFRSSVSLPFDSLKSYFISNTANSLYITSVAIALISSD